MNDRKKIEAPEKNWVQSKDDPTQFIEYIRADKYAQLKKKLEEAVELLKKSKTVMSNEKAGFLVAGTCFDIDNFLKSLEE